MKKLLLSCMVILCSHMTISSAQADESAELTYNTARILSAIGARLACSFYYVTGYEEDKVAEDITNYSSALSLLSYEYDEENKSVTASLSSLSSRTARYQEGIGCALDYDETNARASIQWPELTAPNAPWPLGNKVCTINYRIQQKLDALLEEDNDYGLDTRALLVVHRGKVVAESYADGIDKNTKLIGWSLTKSVTSLLLGHLEMRGLIDVEETDLFEEWTNDYRSYISVEDMLHMADGLDYTESYDIGQTAVTMLFDTADTAEFMLNRELINEPGTYYEYSSGTATLLSYLIQKRLEGDYNQDAQTIATEFFAPLGLYDIVYETDPTGLFMGSAYLYASARDWAKIGQLMLNGGVINGTRLVNKDYIERSLKPNNTENHKNYGYQWRLNHGEEEPLWPDLPANSYSGKGFLDQRVTVIPDKELVIVRLGWSSEDYPVNDNFNKIQSWFK